MKKTLMNSGLVMVLAGLLFVPVMGFGFAEYKPEESAGAPMVLGKASYELDFKIVDQIDLELNLSKLTVQKFYDVVPEEYIKNRGYKVIIVAPKALSDKGVTFDLIQNKLSSDLLINFNSVSEIPTKVNISLVVFSEGYMD